MTLPAYAVEFRGKPCCPCDREWIPAFEAELEARGLIGAQVDIAQLIGMASASAMVHSKGGAIDIWQIDVEISKIARRMGCVMSPRVTGSFANNKHSHGVLIGCPHLHQQGKDQITEIYAGGDGLVGDVPDDPELRPYLFPKRTWKEGIVWHKEQKLIRRKAELRAVIKELVEERDRLTTKIKKKRDNLAALG